jgi:uncharacterized membrane protein YkvI
MKWKQFFTVISLLSLFSSMAFAEPTSQLRQALQDLCNGLKTMVPVAAMLMVLLAAVIYATGQMMGAETRARANVWATSCLTGALIGIMISTVAPVVLATINNNTPIDC